MISLPLSRFNHVWDNHASLWGSIFLFKSLKLTCISCFMGSTFVTFFKSESKESKTNRSKWLFWETKTSIISKRIPQNQLLRWLQSQISAGSFYQTSLLFGRQGVFSMKDKSHKYINKNKTEKMTEMGPQAWIKGLSNCLWRQEQQLALLSAACRVVTSPSCLNGTFFWTSLHVEESVNMILEENFHFAQWFWF